MASILLNMMGSFAEFELAWSRAGNASERELSWQSGQAFIRGASAC